MEMNRRNALLGLGAVVTGGGALLGSGAFTQVQANRSVSVQLAGDDAALLQLNPLNTTVASTNNGVLQLDFTANASGLNYEAITEFAGVFEITNNGDSSVTVHLGTSSNSAADLAIDTNENQFYNDADSTSGLSAGDPLVQFYANSSVPSNSTSNGIVGSGADFSLAAGASQQISVRIDTRGVDSSIVSSGNELVNEVQVVAD